MKVKEHPNRSIMRGPLDGLSPYQVTSRGGQPVNIWVRKDEVERPVLVALTGSLCAPLFDLTPVPGVDGAMSLTSSVPIIDPLTQTNLGVHLVLPERRAQESFSNDKRATDYTSSTGCLEEGVDADLELRKADAIMVIEALSDAEWAGSVYLLGLSEGADVAAAVAAERKDVAGLLLISGMGVSQFFDLVASSRAGSFGEQGVSDTFERFEDAVQGRMTGNWLGYPADRWVSFGVSTTPLDSLLESGMPVFVAHGELDEAVPIASTDAAVIELMRKQPGRHLLFWSVPNVGHELAGEPFAIHVIQEFIRWIQSPGRRFIRSEIDIESFGENF